MSNTTYIFEDANNQTSSEYMAEILTHPPGVLLDLVNHYAAISYTRNRWPALAGSLAGLSAASGNRYAVLGKDGIHTPLNLYVMNIQGTGDGKEIGKIAAAEAAKYAGYTVATHVTSDASLHTQLVHNSCLMLNKDEAGRWLKKARATPGSHDGALWTMLMELYGMGTGTLAPRLYADRKNNRNAVHRPYVSCLLTSTYRHLEEALGDIDIVDGTMNRMLLFAGAPAKFKPWIDEYPDRQKGLPEPLRKMYNTLSAGHAFHKDNATPSSGDLLKQALIVPDDLTLAKMKNLDAELFTKRNTYLGGIWARAFENILRVAGTLAAADAAYHVVKTGTPMPAEIPLNCDQLEYAEGLVVAGITWSLDGGLAHSITLTDREKLQQRIIKGIRRIEANNPYEEGYVPMRMLKDNLRGAKAKPREIDDEFKVLIEAGIIQKSIRPGTKKRNISAIRIVAGALPDRFG